MPKKEVPYKEPTYKGFPIQTQENGYVEKVLRDIHKQTFAMLSHYTEVIAVRLDLKSPTVDDFDMGSFVTEVKRLLSNAFGNSRIGCVWVREYGRGEKKQHYHMLLLIKRFESSHAKTQNYKTWEIVNRLYNDRAKPKKDVWRSGYFRLERSKLSESGREEQRISIQDAIDNKKKHPYLRIKAIKKRKHWRKEAVGGVIDEFFYAVSYLAKYEQKLKSFKENLKGKRRYSSTQLKPNAKKLEDHPILESILTAA